MTIPVIKRIDFEGSDEDYQDYLDTIKEVETQTEKYAKKKTKKKNTVMASLRSSKDKKFMGHTGRG